VADLRVAGVSGKPYINRISAYRDPQASKKQGSVLTERFGHLAAGWTACRI
jgi:hypothetical protein